MKFELERGQRICPYCNVRHIRRCQEDVDRRRIREIVGDMVALPGRGRLWRMCGVGELVIDFGMCCLIRSSKR